MLEEREETVADQVDGGLVAGDEEEHAGGDELPSLSLLPSSSAAMRAERRSGFGSFRRWR
jgi:hypothetical protein